ncbi:Lysine-specific demethylase 4E [Aphelenchoides besseyi]|nr:Lysine-specific demethylase 4E [Aphelenchoides besseyi]
MTLPCIPLPRYGSDNVDLLQGSVNDKWDLTTCAGRAFGVMEEQQPQWNNAVAEGITSAYTYIGAFQTAFGSHRERILIRTCNRRPNAHPELNCHLSLPSANYHYIGQPKVWIGIDRADSRKFEELCYGIYGQPDNEHQDPIAHKQYLVEPDRLRAAGIRFVVVTQRPGDLIVTLPGGYHSGLNLGSNINVAINFADRSWLPRRTNNTCCPSLRGEDENKGEDSDEGGEVDEDNDGGPSGGVGWETIAEKFLAAIGTL